jgi:3',5'-cyclic AMP phosphodiesterase CpdA
MCAASCALSLVSSAAARADASRIVKGPYLQSLDATSVEIRVEVDPPAPVTVTIAPRASDAGGPRTIRDATAAPFHAVRVDGLAPSTRYSYSVSTLSQSEKGELTTAPRNDSKDPFTFLVYGDDRTDEDAHASVVRAMMQSPSDFLVNTGDYVEDGSEGSQWQSFFDVEKPLLRDRAVFACVGNHELVDGAGTNYLRYFGPTEDAHGAGEKPKLYGSARWGSARIFLLDAMESFGDGPERAWLDDELTRADAEPGLVWRIVVLHQGPWSAGPHGGNPRLLGAGIPDDFAKHHVDLILAGHDHIYERGVQSGLRYVISGGGGAPLYSIREKLPGTMKVEAAHHYVEVTVRPDAIAMTAKRDDGSVLDKCGFTKSSAAWDCDPPPAPAAPAPSVKTTSAESHASPPTSSACGCSAPGTRASDLAAWSALAAALGALVLRARRIRR